MEPDRATPACYVCALRTLAPNSDDIMSNKLKHRMDYTYDTWCLVYPPRVHLEYYPCFNFSTYSYGKTV